MGGQSPNRSVCEVPRLGKNLSGGRGHHSTQANIPSTSRRKETQSMRRCFVLFQMFLKVGRTGRLQRAKVRHCGGLAAPGPLRDALPTEYLLPESPRLGPGPRAHSRPSGLPPCAWPLRDCLPGIPPTLRPPIRAQVRLRRPEAATVQVAVLTRRPKSPAPLHSRRPCFPRASRSQLRTMGSRPGSKGDLTSPPRVWWIWEASMQ